MTLKHWGWVALILLLQALITVAWMTGPHNCTPPDHHHRVHCQHG